MKAHDETSLPKWAQEKITLLRNELAQRNMTLHHLRGANRIMQDGEWFTIQGPDFKNGEEVRSLWILNANNPIRICVLYPNDILLVGRAKVKP